MLILPTSDIAQLLANNAERQWILARLTDLDQQDKEILTKAESSEYVDVSMFPDETRRLLTEFLRAPNYLLSHEDIRTNVMLLRSIDHPDADGSATHSGTANGSVASGGTANGGTANGNALRQVIERARKNIKDRPDFHYEIRNIRGKGYQLVPCSAKVPP